MNGEDSSSPSGRTEEADGEKGGIKSRKIVQLFLLAHGLGVLVGFGLFLALYRTQCSSLLRSKVKEFSSSLESLQHELDTVSKRASSNNATRRILELEHQASTRTSQHHECIELHDNALTRSATLLKENEAVKSKSQELSDENDSLRRTLERLTVEHNETQRRAEAQHARLQNELELSKILAKAKADEVERLKVSPCNVVDETIGDSDLSMSSIRGRDMVELQAAVKRRSQALAAQAFGDTLPYIVLLKLEGPDQTATRMRIEIDRLREMPHSVYTFLHLVEAGLFHETTLQISQLGSVDSAGIVTGGSPASSRHNEVRTQLAARYAKLGWSSTRPLAFSERSTKPCTAYSIGFVDHGPDIEIWLPLEDGKTSGEVYSCFGTVVSSREILSHLGERHVTIVDARILSSGRDEDEL